MALRPCMYRIKTDIRHYRCDSRDKVERLIRNWVIRPTDLLYDDDADDWSPIGEDPGFVDLFASLAEAHDNQPETVITDRAADKAASDRDPVEPTPAASASDSPDSKSQRPGAAILRSGPSSSSQPPVPSDEVEGVIRDSDEITMMTERTLDLLKEDEPEPKPDKSNGLDARPPKKAPETAGPEEKTELIERPEFDDDDDLEDNSSNSSAPARPAAAIIDPSIAVDAGTKEQSGEESPGAIESEPADIPSPLDGDEQNYSAPTLESASSADDDGPGGNLHRHDLPEEVFVTSELTEEEVAENARLDELGKIDEDSNDSVMGSDRESRSQWNIVLDEIPPEDEDEISDSDEGEISDVGPTDETAPMEAKPATDIDDTQSSDDPPEAAVDDTDGVDEAVDSDDDDDIDPLRDTDELLPSDRLAAAEADEIDEIDELRDTDELDEQDRDAPPIVDADAVGIDEDEDEKLLGDEDEIDETLDGAFDDLEESAIAAREAEDDEDLEEIPIVEALPVRDPDAVSAGYEIEFSVPIEPSEELLELGIKRSYVSTKKRDRRFSRPRPKKSGELVTTSYSLTRQGSSSNISGLAVAVVAVAVIVSILVILTVVL